MNKAGTLFLEILWLKKSCFTNDDDGDYYDIVTCMVGTRDENNGF
jgi:hypothetical protein